EKIPRGRSRPGRRGGHRQPHAGPLGPRARLRRPGARRLPRRRRLGVERGRVGLPRGPRPQNHDGEGLSPSPSSVSGGPGQTLASDGAGFSLLAICLKVAPTLTFGAFLAGTSTVSPVRGLRAVVAFFETCSKVTKPVRETLLPS